MSELMFTFVVNIQISKVVKNRKLTFDCCKNDSNYMTCLNKEYIRTSSICD